MIRLKDSFDGGVSVVSAALAKGPNTTEQKKNHTIKESDLRGQIRKAPILIATPSKGILVVIDNTFDFVIKAFPST
jgi:hypothetical protein